MFVAALQVRTYRSIVYIQCSIIQLVLVNLSPVTCNDILLDNPIVKTKYVLYRSYFQIHLTIRADILQTNFNC